MKRKLLINIIIFFIILIIVVLGFLIYVAKEKYLLFVLGALVLCFPFIYRFEKKMIKTEEIVLISVITAITVVGRLVFAVLPGSPVTAILIFAAGFFGKETGFIIGVLTTLLSNLFLGHGPWTAFQMAAWGLIGFLSGFFRPMLFPKEKVQTDRIDYPIYLLRKERRNLLILSVWGLLSGILFSLLMDISTVYFIYKKFIWKHYLAVVTVALPVTLEYMVTNVIFVVTFYQPMVTIFSRIRDKYGIGI
ncbi:MAG: ECF transporter S component [Bacilli bacterium]|nr:ECF transporter S component [Bacilli bacterium]MDD4077298.1 ECF transporter S component [Bacilli bacterium]